MGPIEEVGHRRGSRAPEQLLECSEAPRSQQEMQCTFFTTSLAPSVCASIPPAIKWD